MTPTNFDHLDHQPKVFKFVCLSVIRGHMDNSTDAVDQLLKLYEQAGLNMLTATMAFELKRDRILVVCMCPGYVGTDMGNYCLE